MFFTRNDVRSHILLSNLSSLTRNLYQKFRLSYDRNTGQYSSTSDSITVSVPGFGDTYSVERLSGGLITFPYFNGFVDYFVKRGYERGRSIRAAPYDWRLGPGIMCV